MPFDRLFIRAGGQTYGPFTIEQIGQAILDRRLTPSHEVSPDGESWFAAGTIWNDIRPITPPPPDLDDSHRRRRRRRSSGESSEQRRTPPEYPAEPGPVERAGEPQASPPQRPPPPLPPRLPTSPESSQPPAMSSPEQPPEAQAPQPLDVHGRPQPTGTAPAVPSPAAPPQPAEPFPLSKGVPPADETMNELDLGEPVDEPSTSRRRRRRSGSRRYQSHASDRYGSGGGGEDRIWEEGELLRKGRATVPTVTGVAARVSLVALALVLVAQLVVAIGLLMTLWEFRGHLGELEASRSASTLEQLESSGARYAAVIEPLCRWRRILFAVAAGLAVLSASLFLSWKYRLSAYFRNSGVTGLQFTPGGAIGWYFVPIAGLFKPYQAMRELWIAADPHSYDHRHRDSSGLVAGWWATWILGCGISALLYFYVSQLVRDADKVTALEKRLNFEPFYILFGLLETILLFVLMTKLSRRLKQKIAADAAYE